MKNIYLFAVLFCFSLMGCNNSDSKNTKEKERVGVVGETRDDVASENSNHLMFKGVPIDGTLKEFVKNMKRKGFESVGSENGVEILRGDFAAYKGCFIYVYTLDNKDLVSKISVVFPERETWDRLYGDYSNLKELLTEKYGEPASVTEMFQEDYVDDDQERILAVELDKCKYESNFITENGEILLSIEHGKYMTCFVVLVYRDKVNGDIIKDIAIDDL
jgi:hypothetical protein